MKKALVIICLTFFTGYVKAQTLKDSILAVNFSYYLNKPIDSLISALPASYDSVYTRAGSSTFMGATVVLEYSHPYMWVYISPGSHNYFTPLNAAHKPPHIAWPLNLVRKEKTWKIQILDDSDLPVREICCGN